jgi:CBS domain-containing protein
MTLHTTERLEELTAADLMSCDLLLIPRHMSLRAAARLLSKADVSGAPVVDDAGVCVGVISAADFVHWAEGEPGRRSAHPAAMSTVWQLVSPDSLPVEEVEAHMTRDPVMVPPTMALGALARAMVDAHIHRVVVAGRDRRPVGVVSSIDVLAAVARALGEGG